LIFRLAPLTGLVHVMVVARAGVAASAVMPASSHRFIRNDVNTIMIRLAKFRPRPLSGVTGMLGQRVLKFVLRRVKFRGTY
jgi:hypothetical protein